MSVPRSASSRWARMVLLAVAALVTLFAIPARARGELSGRVLIVTSGAASSLIEEGLVRVRGELAAMGLGTELRVDGSAPGAANLGAEFQGALVFERFGDWLRIQAWNPAAPLPVTQWIDASDPTVDAEVIAIRAVEALRAALLPYLKHRIEDPTPSEPAQSAAERPAAARSNVPRPAASSNGAGDTENPTDAGVSGPGSLRGASRAAATAWLGPAVGFDFDPGIVRLGAQLGASYGKPALSGGVRFDVTRAKVPVPADAGKISVMRYGVALEARTRFRVVAPLEAYAAAAGGIVHHRVESTAAPGYSAESAGHTSPSLLGEVGGLYWFVPRLGAYVGARVAVATDAPVVRVNRNPVATLDRPEVAFSGGVMLSLE